MTKHEQVIMTADLALTFRNESIVLIRRKHAPFIDKLVMPGGHVDTGETTKQACLREAMEEINLTGINENDLQLLAVLDANDRDPRPGRRISIVYHFNTDNEKTIENLRACSDADSIILMDLSSITKEKIGFDHYEAIKLLLKGDRQ